MGYCTDDFLEESGFEKACVDFFKEANLDSEFLGDFLLQELERICQMERPHDSDYRFGKYRKYFIKALFNAITGGDSECITLGERLSIIFNLVEEQPISLKYVDTHNSMVSYEYPFKDESVIESGRETIYLSNDDFDEFIKACDEARKPNDALLKIIKGESIHEDRQPGRFKDQIKYSSDCFDSEE